MEKLSLDAGGQKKKEWNTPQKIGGTLSEPPTHLKTPIAVTLCGQKWYQSAPYSIPHPSTYSPY
jgi:hypothetical protein